MEYHIGQRLSLRSQLCTVLYIGSVAAKSETWLGVEWDDPTREAYSPGRSASATAASFLKSTQSWDAPRTFLQALHDKYMSDHNPAAAAPAVYFSSKQAEEVGFEKFARRQAQLQGIHVLVLDRMRISAQSLDEDADTIGRTCAHITSLDVGANLFETWTEIAALCRLFPKLQALTLDGNRFVLEREGGANEESAAAALCNVRNLSLADCCLEWPDVARITQHMSALTSLTLANNGWSAVPPPVELPEGLKTLDLSGNAFVALAQLEPIMSKLPRLAVLSLKGNRISRIAETASRSALKVSASIEDVDLAYNDISTWTPLNELSSAFPALKHLRVAGNPLYQALTFPTTQQPLTTADGYMLTIARIATLATINYSVIGDKERLNAETYYLSLIASELSLATSPTADTEILARHPRWQILCDDYGAPAITRQRAPDTQNPNSLGAKLISLDVWVKPSDPSTAERAPTCSTHRLPPSVNIYFLLGFLGAQLGRPPHSLRLIWETGEYDPVGSAAAGGPGGGASEGPEWWDSDDEADDNNAPADGLNLIPREVELVPGTRALGTYVEGRSATVRVEIVGDQSG